MRRRANEVIQILIRCRVIVTMRISYRGTMKSAGLDVFSVFSFGH